jgi:hypothetical protein
VPYSRLYINVALTGIMDDLLRLADARGGVEIGRDGRLRFEKHTASPIRRRRRLA